MNRPSLEAAIAIVTASNRQDLRQVVQIMRLVSEDQAVSLLGRVLVLGMKAHDDLLKQRMTQDAFEASREA